MMLEPGTLIIRDVDTPRAENIAEVINLCQARYIDARKSDELIDYATARRVADYGVKVEADPDFWYLTAKRDFWIKGPGKNWQALLPERISIRRQPLSLFVQNLYKQKVLEHWNSFASQITPEMKAFLNAQFETILEMKVEALKCFSSSTK